MSKEDSQATHARLKSGLDWSWLAWVLPLVAIIMAGWLVYRAVPGISASVVITVPDAEGIRANSTLVFHRGVEIGSVKSVALAEDLTAAELRIDLSAGNDEFARAGTQYWVVRPELENAGLQGLTTIVSGPQIHAKPGSGETIKAFTMLTVPPLNNVSPEDLDIHLLATGRGAIGRGSKVSYRGLNAGVVTGIELTENSNKVRLDVNIFTAFRHLVRENTVFWNSGGLAVDFGLFSGADIRASSVSSLLAGEVSFATPDGSGLFSKPGDIFTLAEEADDDWLEWEPDIQQWELKIEPSTDTTSTDDQGQ